MTVSPIQDTRLRQIVPAARNIFEIAEFSRHPVEALVPDIL